MSSAFCASNDAYLQNNVLRRKNHKGAIARAFLYKPVEVQTAVYNCFLVLKRCLCS